MSDLVYGFGKPHRPGSICGVTCYQCAGREREEGEDPPPTRMSGLGSTRLIEPRPLYIIRPASYAEYVTSAVANGGGGANLSRPSDNRHYYFVSTD